MSLNVEQIIKQLKRVAVSQNKEGMARFGIDTKYALGVSVPNLRKIAKEIGKNHQLAQELWQTKIHEARILASMIDDPKEVGEKQMDKWIKEFNSWDLCDQCCMNLFDKLPLAYRKAKEWAGLKPEFEKRAGFALMACLALHDKQADDKNFEQFFLLIEQAAGDERNFVKKAVNWALRQIGKRNKKMNKMAIKTAEKILKQNSKSAQWIAKDALKELKTKS